jgi:ATP-dependent protease ClpP protease subunit
VIPLASEDWNKFSNNGSDEIEYLNLIRFNLFGYLTEEVARGMIEAFWEQDNDDQTAVWDVCINSEGGDMAAGTAIYSELRSYSLRGGGGHQVITRVRGQAASCGSLILQAGDVRIAGVMDSIMLHEPLLSFDDATLQRVRDELLQAECWTESYLDVIMERALEGRDFFAANITGRDWWITAQNALAYGLIDEVA